MDYPSDPYDENPEIYEAVGWDRDTYVMVGKWCFVDDKCTAGNFHYIAENSNAR